MNFIYITTNNTNGKQYVGSHNGEIDDRYLGSGKLLLRAIKLYGRHNFTRQIIQECDPIDNLILEERYIKQYSTIQPNGYNISPTGGHGLNGKLSEKTKEKLRKPKSESAKMNMSLGKRGIEFSDEHRKNISASKSGKNHPNWGKHISEETKNRIRISNLGQKRTEEQKKKMGRPKGSTMSETSKQLIGAGQLGRKRSIETKEKIRLKALAREETKRKNRINEV